jgi:prepilin-type N-terminal cleavage/methylation domain-containing protein
MKSRSRGFNLTELLVVMALAAIVFAIGAPSFTQFRLNNRLTNSANDVLGATVLARTEAIKQQRAIAVCPSANPLDDAASCTANSTVGWIVFVDTDGSCTREATETLINSRAFDNDNVTNPLRVKYDGECLSFAPTGFRQDISGKTTLGRILMCDNRGVAKQAGMEVSAARGILIAPTGRARITRALSGGSADDMTTWGTAGVCP